MKTNYYIIISLILITVLCLKTEELRASHIPGANITYACNPSNPLTYTFTLTVFRKCPGTHPTTMSSTNFSLTNTCALTNPIIPTFTQVGIAQDVNQLCSSATSNCNGGTQPGVWLYTYEATVTLPANCDTWTMAYDLCCRDGSSNLTGTTGNSMATSTTMYTSTAPCNNSPTVTAQPIPYACTNTNFSYCLTTIDPEGDSTYFTMVPPAGAGQAPIAHLPGYSFTAPLTNFVLDPLTGCFTFNEPNIGNYVVAIQINSYDNNGNLIGSIIHDFQVMVLSCTNSPPTNASNSIANFLGTATQTGPNTISGCYGDNFCFDVVFQDPTNPGDVITIVQDGTTNLPGAVFTQTGSNPTTGTLCWTIQPGALSNVITFIGQDNGCPIMGTNAFAVNLDIGTGVYAGPDTTICGAQSAQLQGFGAGAYTWSPATGLSCTNCPNPIATPSSTTTYTVTGNLVGTCNNTDQVTVTIAPDFPLTLNPTSATICANGSVQLSANGPAPFAPFTYNWTPPATLTNSNSSNPIASPLTSTTYHTTVTAANGCTKTDSVLVTVSGVGPTVLTNPTDTTICIGESVPIITNPILIPALCGISSGCTGSTSYAIAGTNTASSTSYSPFYGSTSTTTNYNTKIQYIYTAAELNSLGYNGGTIRDLSLYITSTTGYRYDNVNIWIGCSSQSEYTNTSFIPTSALTQVYGPANNITVASNAWHTFNITDYDWDGSSNLVVQFCAQEDNLGNAGSSSVRYTTTTPAYRCMRSITTSTTTIACNNTTGSRYTNRANMRFNICSESINSPTYSWTPPSTLNNPNIQNPTATPNANTSYLVNVTDGSSGCTGSAIVNVNINTANSITASGDTTICAGDTVHLNSIFNGPIPTTIPCGMNVGGCTGPNNTAIIGTGTASSSTYGPFYGGYYDVKYQFLYTAAELNAMGLQSGTITSIAFNIATKNSTGPFNGFTMRMGCTNADFLLASNGWEPTAGVVYGPTNYTTTAGWNTFNLTTGFDWDGTSNIVIETCFNNSASVGSDSYLYTATPGFDRTMRSYNNTGPGCANTPSYDYPYHPNLRLTICDPPPVGLNYSWTPPTSLSNPNISNPIANPTNDITYVVTATGGICPAYDTVDIIICSILPIELLSFDGVNNGDENYIFWSTSTEINNNFFTIERSSDAINYYKVGTIQGAGNSSSNIDYSFIDENPINGINYYRLKQTDFDENFSYSDVIALEVKKEGELSIFPNPSSNTITISNIDEQFLNSTIKIYDVQGKIVFDDLITEKSVYHKMDISELNDGLYFVRVISSNNTFKGSFLKK